MEKTNGLRVFLVILFFSTTTAIFPQIGNQGVNNNTIGGFVFDATNRSPVPDVYVELLNDIYVTLSRTKTDASGKYGFRGLSSGTFKVKVLPYGTNYQEEIQDVRLDSIAFGGKNTTDNAYLDLYLKPDKRKLALNNEVSGTLFVQEVPADARKLYKEGVTQIDKSVKDPTGGLETLKKALVAFPDYYDALTRLGLEYSKVGKYTEAVPYLIKAITINQRSLSGFYLLGLAAYNLKQYKEAAEAFRAATLINPQFIDSYVQYGMVLRIDGQYKESEIVLLKALSLSKDSPTSDVNWQLALLYDKLKKYKEAADQLEIYLKNEKEAKNAKQIKTLISQMRAKSQN